MKRVSKKEIKDSFIYICESPVLTGYKIGYHKGLPIRLYRRYQTSLTNKVSFTLFPTEFPVKQEKTLHRILNPYRISNEIFQKRTELFSLYCYMAKCITNCEKIQCYSREKYGFPRDKGLWSYRKLEIEEENKLNEAIDCIWKTGNIPPFPENEEELSENIINGGINIEDVSESMNKLDIEDNPSSEEKFPIDNEKIEEFLNSDEGEDPFVSEEEIDQKYVHNPFRKWAYKGPKKNFYDRKNIPK